MKSIGFLFFIFFFINLYSQDTIIKKDGTKIICEINKQDSSKVYFKIYENNNVISTSLYKDEIETLKYYYSQNPDAPLAKSYLNIGCGYGLSYGIIGLKTIIGYQNCGLLLGLGMTPIGTVAPVIGLQVAIKGIYINYGNTVVCVYKYDNNPLTNYYRDFLSFGFMIYPQDNKRIFIDFSFTYIIGPNSPGSDLRYSSYEEHTYKGSLGIGIGYRFGTKPRNKDFNRYE